MFNAQAGYVFAQAPNEAGRLQSWARSWEPESEAMLDRIQVQPGWHAIDLACGPMGIIGPLSRRVGFTGRVIASDINPEMLAAARGYAESNGLPGFHVARSAKERQLRISLTFHVKADDLSQYFIKLKPKSRLFTHIG